MPKTNHMNCTLCRVMRGFAFGGLGAAVAGYGAIWFGAEEQDAVLYALFGAIALTAYMNRKRPEQK
ncbi:MAG: hypothetical protein M3H12_04250 [Chromatiales bacterium]|uniref:hypothetical protein n=1 Tax=endosymbiont of Lamellibrachia barhami TaxID=205975 RepID=UPI0015A7B29E|nr:hypothetical protein [endosymbiont of Lamellibrachia barhami]MBA1444303.1 hypothetical protein [Gammaproteobacteria bacterium]